MMTKLPETHYDKETGINGLRQIARDSRNEEMTVRYFKKFETRMIKNGIPFTSTESNAILKELMDIISET